MNLELVLRQNGTQPAHHHPHPRALVRAQRLRVNRLCDSLMYMNHAMMFINHEPSREETQAPDPG